MADLPSTFSYVTDTEVTADADVTENLFIKLGQNDNYLKDNIDSEVATRIAADASITSTISVAQGLLNVIDSVPKYYTSATEPIGVELLTANRTVSVFFVRDTANDKTFLQVRVQNATGGGSPVWVTSADLGVSPTLWTRANWYWFSIEDQIAWHLFSEVTYVNV